MLIRRRSYNIGLLLPLSSLPVRLEDAPVKQDLSTDVIAYWIGYPLLRQPKPFKINLLNHYLTETVSFIWDIIRSLFTDTTPPEQEAVVTARCLSSRLRSWYLSLPQDLVYIPGMPPGLVEFQYAFMLSVSGNAILGLS